MFLFIDSGWGGKEAHIGFVVNKGMDLGIVYIRGLVPKEEENSDDDTVEQDGFLDFLKRTNRRVKDSWKGEENVIFKYKAYNKAYNELNSMVEELENTQGNEFTDELFSDILGYVIVKRLKYGRLVRKGDKENTSTPESKLNVYSEMTVTLHEVKKMMGIDGVDSVLLKKFDNFLNYVNGKVTEYSQKAGVAKRKKERK